MAEWTPALVEQRLVEAADTLRRLPPVKVQGHASSWPPVVRDFWEAYGWEEAEVRLGPPAAAAIDRMDETFGWLRWLEPDDARLVWARADRAPWKAICWRFGIARATACRRWEYALSLIAWRLRGRRAPARQSRQRLVARVRSLSSP